MLKLSGSSRDTSLAWTSHSPASGQAPAAWAGVVAMASSKLALARQVEFDFDFSTRLQSYTRRVTPVALLATGKAALVSGKSETKRLMALSSSMTHGLPAGRFVGVAGTTTCPGSPSSRVPTLEDPIRTLGQHA